MSEIRSRFIKLIDRLDWIVHLHEHDVMDEVGVFAQWKRDAANRAEIECLIEEGVLSPEQATRYREALAKALQILQGRLLA